MFILDEIVNIVNNLTQFKYRHNLAIGHFVGSVCDHVGLFVKLSFLIMKVYDYVLLNEPRELKDHMDPFQVRGNKYASGTNCVIIDTGCLEGQLVLVVRPQCMTKECTKCLCDGYISPKIQLFQ